MQKLFHNILVPVSFGPHSNMAVNKAVQLSQQFKCDVHLLHVMKKNFWQARSEDKIAEKKSMLHAIRNQYAGELSKGCLLHTSVCEGSREHAIVEYTAIHQIDLVLAGRSRYGLFSQEPALNVNRIAAQTSCPVLTVQTGPSLNGIKNIVLPVSNYLPLRKIMLASYLAKYSDAAIHLITLTGKQTDKEQRSHMYLEKSYQLLRENTTLPLKCKTVMGENIASSALEYAMRIGADLILVDPGGKFKRSSIPVMTVA